MIEGRKVVISAAARLHLGFLDLHGGLGRRFGSIGIAIDGPVTRLSLARAARATPAEIAPLMDLMAVSLEPIAPSWSATA